MTHDKFDGVDHEYGTIPGVYEDVTDIILNLKELLVRLSPGTSSATIKLDPDTAEVPAGDMTHTPLQFAEPELSASAFDHDSDMARATRHRMLAEWRDQPVLVLQPKGQILWIRPSAFQELSI